MKVSVSNKCHPILTSIYIYIEVLQTIISILIGKSLFKCPCIIVLSMSKVENSIVSVVTHEGYGGEGGQHVDEVGV